MRLSPTASTRAVESVVDTTIGGGKYFIPALTTIVSLTWVMQKDPAVWGNDVCALVLVLPSLFKSIIYLPCRYTNSVQTVCWMENFKPFLFVVFLDSMSHYLSRHLQQRNAWQPVRLFFASWFSR